MDRQSPAHPLSVAADWYAAGRKVAVATVIETWSSAPVGPGSHLVIDEHGAAHGSLSGGCVEKRVVDEAADVIASGTAKVLAIDVSDETAREAGLACGGSIRVHIDRIS